MSREPATRSAAFHVAANASRPGLVLLAVGSGTDPFSVSPEFAIELAGRLLDGAAAARDAEARAHATG
ncbi:hypothetical protein [Mycolicibacterium sp. XJ1904]